MVRRVVLANQGKPQVSSSLLSPARLRWLLRMHDVRALVQNSPVLQFWRLCRLSRVCCQNLDSRDIVIDLIKFIVVMILIMENHGWKH